MKVMQLPKLDQIYLILKDINRNRILFLFIIFFLIKGLFYIIYIEKTNTYGSPDDIGHISYIISIENTKQLPILHESTIAHQIALNSFLVEKYKIGTNFYFDKNDIKKSIIKNWINQHPPLYYIVMVPAYKILSKATNNFYNIIYGMKLISLSFGIISLLLIYLLLTNLNLPFYSRIIALSIFVFSPSYSYFYTIINNDPLLFMLCIMTWYLLIQYSRLNNVKYYFIYVIVFSAVIMTKHTGMLGIIPSIIYLLWYMYTTNSMKKNIILLITGCIIGVALIGPYLVRNYILFDTLFPTAEEFIDAGRQYTFYNFIYETIYLNDILKKLVLFAGHKPTVLATDVLLYTVMFIMFILSTQYSKKNNTYIVFVISIILCSFINMNLITSIVVSLYLVLIYGFITTYKYKRDLIFNISIVFSILLVIIAMMYAQFQIYNARGMLGGTQGRYYYVLIFPIIYTMIKDISNIKSKNIIYIILMLLVFLEIMAIIEMSNKWSI